MTVKRLARPLSPLVPPRGDLPFAIQYTLENNLGPNEYEEFWFDSKFFVIKESDFASSIEFDKHKYQKGIIYGPLDQEIAYPAGTIVIGVSTTEQFRPGEDNDGSPLGNQDSDADGISDDADSAPNDYQDPYPDADLDGVHVIPGDPNNDPDDNDPDVPYLDSDQDGYRSNVDPDDTDASIIPEQQPQAELKIQAEYVILYPEPSIFEGVLVSAANTGMPAQVNQSIPLAAIQYLYIEPGAYVGGVGSSPPQYAMRGHMRFSVGGAVSDAIPWDTTSTGIKACLESMSVFEGHNISVAGSIEDVVNGITDNITISVNPPQGDRIMVWGISVSENPYLSVVPNDLNGGIPSNRYKYGFKCRTKFDSSTITNVTFLCYYNSQFGTLPAGTNVMCRRINGAWYIVYP